MRHPTSSKLHRTWQCPASAILPQVVSDEREAATEPARGRGTAIHRFLEQVRAVGIDAALSEVSGDLVALCKALDIDNLPTHLSTEVAYAWNWRDQTARELGRNLGHRDYDSLGVDWSCEIPGTWDVVGVAVIAERSLRRGYVGDYKTGHTRYPRPGRFGQTLLGAACIRYVEGLDDVITELIYIDEYGQSRPARDLVDQWTLDIFERELTAVMESMPKLEAVYAAQGAQALAYHEGSHCDYCESVKACGAKTALIRSMPDELVRIGVKPGLALVPGDKPGEMGLDLVPGAITLRNGAAVYEACERIEAICRRMRSEVCAIAYHEPIELSDGRVIERHKWSKRHVDGRVAAPILERHYGRDKVMAKVDLKIPISAIRDLVAENIDHKARPRQIIESKKTGGGILDKLLEEIKQAKGLAVDEGEECGPHMPRKARGK